MKQVLAQREKKEVRRVNGKAARVEGVTLDKGERQARGVRQEEGVLNGKSESRKERKKGGLRKSF